MASTMFVPRCPLILKTHLETRSARVSTIFLRTAVRMESSTAANAAPESAGTAQATAADTPMQYVVLRRDLIDTWPLGSVVTQGCHASVAAIWENKDDPDTLQYCSPPNLDSMHKVTLEVKGEAQILNLSEKLKAGDVAHKLWMEQPENIATCLATKPYPKSLVSSFFKKLKLFTCSQPEIPRSPDVEEIDEPTNTKRPRWKENEKERLAMAWVNASTDPRLGSGNDQTSVSFWNLVKGYYEHELNPKWPRRSEENIRKQFIILGKAVFSFQSKIQEAFVCKSGESDKIKFEHAMKMYNNEVGADFKYFKAWQVLKDQPKWKLWSESKYKKGGVDGGHATKMLKNLEGDSSPSPFVTPIDSPLVDNTTDCESPKTTRPMGRKAFKRGLNGGSSQGSEQGDLMKILEESEIERKNEHQRLMEATLGHYQNLEMEAKKQNEVFMSDVAHKQAYRDKKEAERKKREEDRILFIDLDDPKLHPQLRNEYALRKQEIIARRFS